VHDGLGTGAAPISIHARPCCQPEADCALLWVAFSNWG
jgi:hypothetical protein